jgi:hypothetical protein
VSGPVVTRIVKRGRDRHGEIDGARGPSTVVLLFSPPNVRYTPQESDLERAGAERRDGTFRGSTVEILAQTLRAVAPSRQLTRRPGESLP